jgi:hypothetical protein
LAACRLDPEYKVGHDRLVVSVCGGRPTCGDVPVRDGGSSAEAKREAFVKEVICPEHESSELGLVTVVCIGYPVVAQRLAKL